MALPCILMLEKIRHGRQGRGSIMALSQEEVTDLLHAAPFQNILPRPYTAEGEKPETKQKRLEAKYSALQIVTNVDKFGTAKQSQLAREGELLTRERLCCGLSLFGVVLRRLRAALQPPHWPAPAPAHAPPQPDDTNEFHRLWSALQFLYCIPVGDTQFTVDPKFRQDKHIFQRNSSTMEAIRSSSGD
ncbi:hypothetical protein evm_014624 [Chilo suppressalis]|nr:hypothetical protein evm_014624 [Chilo suppressalis]